MPTIVSLLGKDDGDRGVNCIRKKEGRPSETESSTVSLDVVFDGSGAFDTFLLARTFGFGVRVAAEMAFFGKSAVEKDAESMECGAAELRVSIYSNIIWLESYLLRYDLVRRRYSNVFAWMKE